MNDRAAVDRWADKNGFDKAQSFQSANTKIGGSTAARQAGFYLLMCEGNSYYLANLSGFISARKSVLFDGGRGRGRRNLFRRRSDDLVAHDIDYEDAGGDCVSIDFNSIEHCLRLLDDPAVSAAAARLNLDVMRKHSCIYTQYHCPQLVERAYPGIPRNPTSSRPRIRYRRDDITIRAGARRRENLRR